MVQKKKIFSREYTIITIVLSILVCMLVLSFGIWIDRNIELFPKLSDIHKDISTYKLEVIISHASMTFISISVMSVLSENNIMVYWENVIKERLINPPFSCFATLTIYAFFTLFFAFVSYFFDSPAGVFLFFVLDICVLTVLSRGMINVYFGRDEKKIRLEKTFCEMNDLKDKRKCLDIMQAYTIVAYENAEYDKLMENCYFYGRYTNVVELRFLFDYIFSKERITAFDCNVLEKIYQGLLDNIVERLCYIEDVLVSENEIYKIYEEVHPLYNKYIRKFFNDFIFVNKENEEGFYGKMELSLLTATFIGNVSVLLFEKIFEIRLDLEEICLDNGSPLYNTYIKMLTNIHNNRDIMKKLYENKDNLNGKKLKLYFKLTRKLIPYNDASMYYNKFAEALFVVLIQLGFLNKEFSEENDKLIDYISRSVNEDTQKMFREFVNDAQSLYLSRDEKNNTILIKNILQNI